MPTVAGLMIVVWISLASMPATRGTVTASRELRKKLETVEEAATQQNEA
jgi:hypothetical protein